VRGTEARTPPVAEIFVKRTGPGEFAVQVVEGPDTTEPPPAILAEFDLPEINIHFPDYYDELRRRLG
jgi:hypothetical protein